MSSANRSDVPPETVGVSLEPEGVEVTYTDGRSVLYHGVPERTEGRVVSGPGKNVHVLVTDPTETEGVMVYVNDRKTDDEILESSGVGRVILDREESDAVFPGVEVTNHGYRIEVVADPEQARGRVFVFVEDELSEQSYEIVAPPEEGADGDAGGAADADADTVDGDT
ncbi:hypothetical protein BRC89_04015 [Halobacteriales archaeon QS_4_70_19]|nr:MAG: hypothetical protein BRC89_04015 [Halobacteriales archaeon QS_4_70_19]